MTKIVDINAEEILDSRGNPTLRVTVNTEVSEGVFEVPSGASTGKHAAHELRDGEVEHYSGLGVKKATRKIEEEISSELLGIDVGEQEMIDKKMIDLDGTFNKERLGGNSLVGVSIACAKAAASAQNKEVYEYLQTLADIKPSRQTPYLFMNLVNGGKHAQNKLAFQEYQIIPLIDDLFEALETGSEIQKELSKVISAELGPESTNLGDEGGFVPTTDNIKKPLEFLENTLKNMNLTNKVKLGLDVAASSFYRDGIYKIAGEDTSTEKLHQLYKEIINDFSILSIEDPFEEDDFRNFARLRNEHPELLVIGDDLTVTNTKRLKQAINEKSINAVIIKPNQIGTLTETLEVMKLARENNIKCVISHRSGSTEDNFIADLAYAFGCYGLKAGAPRGGERIVKYNRLLQITKNK